jgi:hypothetical protein
VDGVLDILRVKNGESVGMKTLWRGIFLSSQIESK